MVWWVRRNPLIRDSAARKVRPTHCREWWTGRGKIHQYKYQSKPTSHLPSRSALTAPVTRRQLGGGGGLARGEYTLQEGRGLLVAKQGGGIVEMGGGGGGGEVGAVYHCKARRNDCASLLGGNGGLGVLVTKGEGSSVHVWDGGGVGAWDAHCKGRGKDCSCPGWRWGGVGLGLGISIAKQDGRMFMSGVEVG